MTNIILCGGAGTRLWPVSRAHFPKQFCDLGLGESLFSGTVRRNDDAGRYVIVTNAVQYPMAADQMAKAAPVGAAIRFILEPVGRNTAPAIALACLALDRAEIVVVTPSDHVIADTEEYRRLLQIAVNAASRDRLVTFGIRPSYAETGYGYIEASSLPYEAATSSANGQVDSDGVRNVASFREKPDRATAERYVASGGYFWNSGMFVFRVGTFLDELTASAPDIALASERAALNAVRRHDPQFGFEVIEPTGNDMSAIPADSVDYAVMEKSRRVVVVPASFGWNDVGSFDALYDASAKDADENAIPAGTVAVDARKNLVLAKDVRVALVGVEGAIVVATGDAVLVANRGHSQSVKDAVERLRLSGPSDRALVERFAMVTQEWGTETSLDASERYEVRSLCVAPGREIPLRVRPRPESWTVAAGRALVRVGNRRLELGPGDRLELAAGDRHSAANAGPGDFSIITVIHGPVPERDDTSGVIE